MKPSEYLDKCKIALQVQTDYALAKKLGTQRANISQMYKGKRWPDNYTCAKMALTLGIDPLEVIADIEAQSAKKEDRARFWEGFLQRSGKAAAAVLLALSLLISSTIGGGLLAGGEGLTKLKEWLRLPSRKFA